MLVASITHPGQKRNCSTQQLAQTSATFASCLINSTLTGRAFNGPTKGTVVHFFPWKLTNSSPTKINGWFRCIPHWGLVPVLGDILVFGAVYPTVSGNFGTIIIDSKKCRSGEEMHSFPGGWIYGDWDSIFRFFWFKFHLRSAMDFYIPPVSKLYNHPLNI